MAGYAPSFEDYSVVIAVTTVLQVMRNYNLKVAFSNVTGVIEPAISNTFLILTNSSRDPGNGMHSFIKKLSKPLIVTIVN